MRLQHLELTVAGQVVEGALWLPDELPSPLRLVVFGHGLGHDCRSALHAKVATALADEFGIAGLALDAPGHGSRRPHATATDEESWHAYRAQWRLDAGAGIAAEITEGVRHVERIVGMPVGSIGYWGLSLGTQYGLAFLARAPRTRAAVLGLFGAGSIVSRYAERIECPVLFMLQEDDEVHPRSSVAELFRQLSSESKQLISSPGAHTAVPGSVIRRGIEFLARSLEER
jgi:pimeloyl-ACP methyl ester carboxylesterase